MRSKPSVRYFVPLAIVAVLAIGLMAWDFKQTPPQNTKQSTNDTIPKQKKIRDLDEALDELNRVDIEKEIANAMKDVERALKDLDKEKIRLEIDKAMREVDFEKIKADMQKAMKEVDAAKIRKEIDESMAKIDFEKIKAEMEEVKRKMPEIELEMKKVEQELKELGPKLKLELEKAKEDIEKAKEEIKEYKAFVDGLEKDGLLDKNNYTIEHRNGELFINGKKQPESVYNKYKTFLDKHKKITIKKNEDGIDIDD